MTALLSCTMSGFLLPPHLIYCDKTNAILILPSPLFGTFITAKTRRASMNLLLILICSPQRIDWVQRRIISLLHYLTSSPHTVVIVFINPWKEDIFIPGNRTKELQPLVLTVNQVVYADHVKNQLGEEVELCKKYQTRSSHFQFSSHYMPDGSLQLFYSFPVM